MHREAIIQISAFPDWIVGVSLSPLGYQCWVLSPDLDVLNDGEWYDTSAAAMAAGRFFVECSLERG